MSRRKRSKRNKEWRYKYERDRVVVCFPRPWEGTDGISPGRLVAWAEWRGGREKSRKIY